MVDPKKINGMLRNLEQYLEYLVQISETERSELLADAIKIGGARYYLQIAIETCLNIGNHIIGSEGMRSPEGYRDVFSVLNENEIIPDELTRNLRMMAGLRNRLVHLYWEIDDEQIIAFIQQELADFEYFAKHIASYMESASD